MDKQTQDILWSVLSKEDRDKERRGFATPSNSEYSNGYDNARKNFFGHHNLTSDTEPEEMLITPRKQVLEYYKDVQQAIGEENGDTRVEMEGRKMAMRYFFGDKCQPDTPNTPNSGELKSQMADNKPRFKVGDKVRISLNPKNPFDEPKWLPEMDKFKGQIVTLARKESDGDWEIEEGQIKFSYSERWFEPYTEPETKDNMEEKELNLCELLKDCIGDTFFHPHYGDVELTRIDEKSIIVTDNEGYIYTIVIKNLIAPTGMAHLYPDAETMKKYPFDGEVAWREWASERKPKRWTPQIGERIFWVNANLTVSQDRFNDFETQRKRRAVGNEFKTGKEAQQAAEAVRECLEKFHEDHTKP